MVQEHIQSLLCASFYTTIKQNGRYLLIRANSKINAIVKKSKSMPSGGFAVGQVGGGKVTLVTVCSILDIIASLDLGYECKFELGKPSKITSTLGTWHPIVFNVSG